MSRRRDQPGPTPLPGGLAYRNDDGGRAKAGVPGKGDDHHGPGHRHRDRRGLPGGPQGNGQRDGGTRLHPHRQGISPAVWVRAGAHAPRSPRPTLSEAHIAHGDCIVEIAGGRASMKRRLCALAGGALRDVRDHRTHRWRGPATGGGNRPVEVRERQAQAIWVRR